MPSPLDQSRAYWDAHARRDPLWAILSEPSRKHAGWDVESFFQTGVAEIAAMFYEVDSRGIRYDRGSALDFGCGVGRLTQALASHVEQVVGIDVSPRMIELARQLNRHADRVVYLANAAPDLTVVGDRRFDVLITQVVLQHIDPDLANRYVGEFFRVVRPDGLIVFQWPSHRRPPEESQPAAPRVMPDAAYRLAATVIASPAGLGPGETATLEIEIANASPIAWSRDAYGAISAGNHWTTAEGRLVQRDDGRSPLPGLEPGERCRVSLAIAAPRKPGVYVCEIDAAHEGVLWFSDRGVAPARITFQVGAAPTEPPPPDVPVPLPGARAPRAIEGVSLAADDPGDFPMHGRTRAQVERLIDQHGGSVLHVESDPSCGRDWVSYRYYVRNRG
jgi:SAM-dependent methyltransferase